MLLIVWTTVLAGELEVLGARITPCVATTESGAVEQALDEAEARLLYLETDTALRHLELAEAGLACLEEPPAPTLGARLWFAYGIVQVEHGDESAAEAAFRRALVFEPELAWSDSYAPSKRPAFDRARSSLEEEPQAVLQLRGLHDDHRVWLDGRMVWEAELSTPAGDRVLHVRGPSSWTGVLELPADTTAALLFPTAAPPPPLPEAVTEARRRWPRGATIGAGALAAVSGAAWGYTWLRMDQAANAMTRASDAYDEQAYDISGATYDTWLDHKDIAEIATISSSALFAVAFTLDLSLGG